MTPHASAHPSLPADWAEPAAVAPLSEDVRRYTAPWQPTRQSAGLRFEPDLEALYEASTRDARVHELRLTISLAAMFYVLTSVTDPVMVPDIGWLGFWLRCSTLPIWLVLMLFARRFSAAFREFYVAALGTYSVTLIGIIAQLSSAPNAPYEFTIAMLTVIYINTTYPLRFGQAVAASAASLALTLWLLFSDAGIALGLAASIGLLFGVAASYSLISCYRIERGQRLAFLLSHRESQRLAVIAADRDAASARSDTDALTGLPNRRHFDRRLAALLYSADRGEKKRLGLLMLDVDHFKSYNDHHGHPAGDAALHRIARIIEQVVREDGDFAARYGGEEFALLLKDTEPARMRSIAQRIREAIERGAIAHRERGDGVLVVTVSIGAASAPTGVAGPGLATAATELIERADRALYAAKKAGRNCVEFAVDNAVDRA